MALHLIIDGYNLIRQSPDLLAQESQDLRWGREALLEKLAGYRRLKKHAITVVFDGWEAGEGLGNRDRVQGMLVIYSRRGEKADEVIKRMANREREGSLIISSDREIMEYAERAGAAVMSAEEFSFRLYSASAADGLDESEEEQAPWSSTKKKGPAHRDSKKQRRQRRRVKKI
jgi:predicted RNA-binding protein with PIN domain